MYSNSENSSQLAAIAQELCVNEHASADLLCSIAKKTCQRFPKESANFAQISKLIAAGAFTEAVLTLVEFELPQWKLRRLAYDEEQWRCALSRQRKLPEWLEQSVEANHTDLTLAIALAYIKVLNSDEAPRRPTGRTVPEVRARRFETLQCENYA